VQTLAQSAGAQSSSVTNATNDDADPEAADTARLSALMPMDETQLLYSICLHGRADLGLAPDEYAALTMVLLRLLAFKPQGASASAEKKTLINAGQGAAPVAAAASMQVAQAARVPVLMPAAVPIRPVAPVAPPAAAPAMAPAALRPATVQPWEDAPVPAPDPVVPPGHVLPVRDSALRRVPEAFEGSEADDFEKNGPLAPARPAQVATKVVAVPVRQAIETRADASAAQAAPVLIPTEEGDFWHATVQALIAAESITAMVRELALQSQLIARDTDQWILRVERESLNQPGSRDRLTNALAAAGFGVKLVVEVGRVTDSPGRRNSAASAEKQLAAERIIFDDPFVQSMMRDFGAKIVPGSIKPL
jgi:DNA polymerase III subunit gamma/tau